MALTQVNSEGIKDGEIKDADVNTSAAIAGSKLAAATTSAAGSMSAADKTKLDGVATSATANPSAPALTGSTDNTICTVTGANAIQGEANLTFDGSTLDVNGVVEVNNPSLSTDAKLIVKGNDTDNHDIITAYANSATRGSFAIRTGTGVSPSFLVGTRGGSETFALMTNGTERLRVTDNGLTFNGDTAAANALDDYEEGTWTPALSFNADTGITYDTAGADATGGTYTKIGRQVTVHGTIYLTSKGSSTGSAKIHGLPFTSSGDDNNRGSGSVGYIHSMNLDGPILILEERGGNTWFYIRALNANFDGSHNLTSSSFTDTSRLFFSLTYNTQTVSKS